MHCFLGLVWRFFHLSESPARRDCHWQTSNGPVKQRSNHSQAASEKPTVWSNAVIMKYRDTRVLQLPVSSRTKSGRYSSTQPNAKRQTALLNATGVKHILKSLADSISTIPEWQQPNPPFPQGLEQTQESVSICMFLQLQKMQCFCSKHLESQRGKHTHWIVQLSKEWKQSICFIIHCSLRQQWLRGTTHIQNKVLVC